MGHPQTGAYCGAVPTVNPPVDSLAPVLHTGEDDWTGTFPGLGTVVVAPDGACRVSDAASADAHRALLHGWAELLSWARRGFRLVRGASIGPADDARAILLLGDPHDVTIAVLSLSRRGWLVLSDSPSPANWMADQLLAHPRPAPILVSERRAAKAQVSGELIRSDSDVLAVALPRCEQARPVAAVVRITMRKPGESSFSALTGHNRFEAATRVFLGGVLNLDDADTGPDLLAHHLRLAQLPFGHLRLDSSAAATVDQELNATESVADPLDADPIAALLAWWDEVKAQS